MIRPLLATSLAGILAITISLAQERGQTPSFKTGTTVVRLDVSVLRGKAYVEDLTADDFEVLDNGVRQAPILLASDQIPVDVSLVFDRSASALVILGRASASHLPAMAAMLRSADRLRVMTFATDVREILAMQPPGAWNESGLPDLTPTPAIRSLLRPGRPDRDGLDLRRDPEHAGSALFDALLVALGRPAEPGRRHVVVALSLGKSAGVVDDGSLLEAVAARADALLHVAFWDRRVLGIQRERGLFVRYTHDWAGAAAASTGGAVHAAQDEVSAFKVIMEKIRRSHTLQYTATGVSPGGWHTVTVRTPRFPQYTVRARRGYLGR